MSAPYSQRAVLKFRTPAPVDAPEVKGYTCYFDPKWLEWTIESDGLVRVAAYGPPTRTSRSGGNRSWAFANHSPQFSWGEPAPSWISAPTELLDAAIKSVQDVEALRVLTITRTEVTE